MVEEARSGNRLALPENAGEDQDLDRCGVAGLATVCLAKRYQASLADAEMVDQPDPLVSWLAPGTVDVDLRRHRSSSTSAVVVVQTPIGQDGQ